MKNIFVAILIFLILLFIFGFSADLIFPRYTQNNQEWVFRGSYAIGLTFFNLALVSLLFTILIVMVTRQGSSSQDSLLTLRRWLVSGFFLITMLVFSFGSIYTFTKQIRVDDTKIFYHSMFEQIQVSWSDVTRVEGNFIAGSRFGLGRGSSPWVELQTRQGNTMHLSLRCMAANSKLEEVINQKMVRR